MAIDCGRNYNNTTQQVRINLIKLSNGGIADSHYCRFELIYILGPRVDQCIRILKFDPQSTSNRCSISLLSVAGETP